ncbi:MULTISPECIES: DUF3021 family protein [Anaerotruncus]|uniref:DUF3021 family protein n=1 Tax=Anaerotruncus TaxID=244127 RepID=UPI000832CF63|nr:MULTISPECIES: DUF3021 family protein [Anaerotruncus]RGX56973.1 DUF3021 family protein [Anaerotruncus sp. AF02-27]
MSKLINWAIAFKPLMLMYFAAGVFIMMFWDLIWGRAGSLPTVLLWQIFLAAVLLTITHLGFFPENKPFSRRDFVLHILCNYVIMAAMAFGFGWVSAATFQSAVVFTGIFAVFYAAAFTGFYLYYRELRGQLNEKLMQYKQG